MASAARPLATVACHCALGLLVLCTLTPVAVAQFRAAPSRGCITQVEVLSSIGGFRRSTGDCDTAVSVSGTGTSILSSVSVSQGGGVSTSSVTATRTPSPLFDSGIDGGTATATASTALPPTQDIGTASSVVSQTRGRPVGTWDFVEQGSVPQEPDTVWASLEDYGNFLTLGYGDLATVVEPEDGTSNWNVELSSGGSLIFEVQETNETSRYHVAVILQHTSEAFTGVSIVGSSMYVQALPGDSDGTTKLEIGWGGRVRPSASRAAGILLVESLAQQMIQSLESSLGDTCQLYQNERSIEGICNNLIDTKLGAVDHPLRRLERNDPGTVDAVGDQPTGPTEISPRFISNMLFAQSPGKTIMVDLLESVIGQCLRTTSQEGLTWEMCPGEQTKATRGSEVVYTLDYEGIDTNDDGSLSLKFKGKQCNLRVMFVCDGAARLDFAPEPCGSKSNRLFHPNACLVEPGMDNVLTSKDKITDLFWSFGQFVDHDLDLTPVVKVDNTAEQPGIDNPLGDASSKEFPIEIPTTDFFFHNATMEFDRSLEADVPGTHVNKHSAFADLAQVYGVDSSRADALRSFEDGKLKMGPGLLLPYNKASGIGALGTTVENEPDEDVTLFAAGDIRANEQPTLLCLHTLWAREHNRLCDELVASFPNYDDEKLYQTARSIAIAEYQSILFGEWLPLLLGPGEVDPTAHVYDATVDPSINAVFSTVAFRFGHTMVGSYLWRQGPGPSDTAKVDLLPLREGFFNADLVANDNIDSFLRGAAWHLAQEVDCKVVDELRNFLFSETSEEPHLDLVSLNIQRGRDMGLPSLNDLRVALGLPAHTKFSDITDDESVWRMMQKVYKDDISLVDPFVGGISEEHVEGGLLGSTFHNIIKDQFLRMRDGDRFFYEGFQWDDEVLEAYPRITEILNNQVRIADVIERNTDITKEELGIGSRQSAFQL